MTLQRRIQDALDSSTSPHTRRAYAQAWRRFEAWAASRVRGHSMPGRTPRDGSDTQPDMLKIRRPA